MDARRAALLRLGTLATGLLVLFVVFNVAGLVDRTRIESWVDSAGIAAPLAYVVVAGILGAVLVPGAALAAAAGLLFGAVAGALVSLPSAVVTAVLARTFSARTGGDALDQVSGERLAAITSFARRHGFSAVVVQRLLPVVPDGPFSHAFGLAGVKTRDIALATLVASGPRAFSYALLGANADDLTGPHALFAIGLNVATGALGLGLAWAVVRSERRRTADGVSGGTAADDVGDGPTHGPAACGTTGTSSRTPVDPATAPEDRATTDGTPTDPAAGPPAGSSLDRG